MSDFEEALTMIFVFFSAIAVTIVIFTGIRENIENSQDKAIVNPPVEKCLTTENNERG